MILNLIKKILIIFLKSIFIWETLKIYIYIYIYLIIVLEGIFNLKKKKLILKKVKITFQRIIIKPILKCFTKKKKTKYGILLKIFIRKTLLLKEKHFK